LADAEHKTTRAKAEWDADRAYMRAAYPGWDMPAWSRAPAWRRRPYVLNPDQARADREADQRGERIEVADD
jgi:hypothetical protein